MGVKPANIIKKSLLYQSVVTIYRWSQGSILVRLLNDKRVLIGGLVLFLIASLLRVLASDIHVAIQFMSFALLFVVLLAITWQYTDPLTDL